MKYKFMIQVYDIKEGIIGHISSDEFRKAMGVSHNNFIPELVKKFNDDKKKKGEPERVKQVLVKN